MRSSVEIAKQYRAYRLGPFREIIAEIVKHFNDLEGLQDKNILELGPANKINMLRFLHLETAAESVQGIGRHMDWPWLGHKELRQKLLTNSYLLPALNSKKSKSVDLIYSRYVLEECSINPFILLGNRYYWKAIKENRFKNPDKNFPASTPNIEAIFKETWRLLKPGGIIISEIAKEHNNPLDDAFFEKLKPAQYEKRRLGKISSIYVAVKSTNH